MNPTEANGVAKAFMMRLSQWLRPEFPHHASALAAELAGTRLTVDRWNRIAAILASLHSIPGMGLNRRQHDIRNLALSAVHVATRMAGGLLGAHHSSGFLEFAVWRAQELDKQI